MASAELAELARLLAQLQSARASTAAGSPSAMFKLVGETLSALELEYETNPRVYVLSRDGLKVGIIPLEPCRAAVFVYLPVKVPEGRRTAFARHLCTRNYKMHVGKWEMDMNDGEVRFNASFGFTRMPENKVAVARTLTVMLATAETMMSGAKDELVMAALTGLGLEDLSAVAAGPAAGGGRARSASNAGAVRPAAPAAGRLRLLETIRKGGSDPDVARRLIRGGGQDVNQACPKGITPLIAASSRGFVEVARVLLASGADVTVRSNNQDSALSMAVYKSHSRVALLLIEAGHPVDQEDKAGDTPMLDAAKNGLLPVVKALHARGASVSTKNRGGKNALQLALDKGHAEVVQFLLSNGGLDS